MRHVSRWMVVVVAVLIGSCGSEPRPEDLIRYDGSTIESARRSRHMMTADMTEERKTQFANDVTTILFMNDGVELDLYPGDEGYHPASSHQYMHGLTRDEIQAKAKAIRDERGGW